MPALLRSGNFDALGPGGANIGPIAVIALGGVLVAAAVAGARGVGAGRAAGR